MSTPTNTIIDQAAKALVELNETQLRKAVPAIFAKHAAPDVSKRYSFFSTAEILPVLRDNGFVPTSARTRQSGGLYGRHRIELFHEDDLSNLSKGLRGESPRIILENSHDRTCRLNLMAGFYRLVCSNGMVVSSGPHAGFKALHLHLDAEGIKKLAGDMSKMLDSAAQQVEAFKTRMVTKIEAATLANYAIEVRYRGYKSVPVEAKELLTVRRKADEADDLWTVFNRVQENVVRGGVATRAGRKSRGVTSFHLDVDVNRRLWAGAEALFAGGTRGIQALRKSLAE